MLGQLVNTIISLARFSNLIRDRFFYDKFSGKIYRLLTNSIPVLNKSGDNVAQFQIVNEKAIESIDDILETFDDLKYLNLVRPSPLFLQTQKNLLMFRLELMKNENRFEFKTKSVERGNIERKHQEEETKKVVSENIVKKNLKLNQSKKKILEFIKSYPNIRTKDIISEFNALSDRTVKRNLTDLLRTGFIKKKIDNKAVYYYASE